VARDEDAEAVLSAERARGACGAGASGESRELAVRHDFSARDVAEGARERLSVRGQVFQVELDVGKVLRGAGKEGAKPGDESWREVVSARCVAGG